MTSILLLDGLLKLMKLFLVSLEVAVERNSLTFFDRNRPLLEGRWRVIRLEDAPVLISRLV